MEEKTLKEQGIGTKVLIFVFGFMFLYIAISYLGTSVEIATIVSIAFIILIYGFMERNWAKHLKSFLKKEEDKSEPESTGN